MSEIKEVKKRKESGQGYMEEFGERKEKGWAKTMVGVQKMITAGWKPQSSYSK